MPYESSTSPGWPGPIAAKLSARTTRRTTPPEGSVGEPTRSWMSPVHAGGRSSGPTLSWQLPKRSTHSTSATTLSVSSRGSGTMPGSSNVGVDRPELGEVDAVAEVGGDRSEDVAAGERGARARRGGTRVGQLDGAAGATGHRDRRREQTVVGPDQHASAAGHLDRDRLAIAADAGIDDGEDDAGGHVGDARASASEPARTSNGRNVVGEVDDVDMRSDVADHGT